MDENFWHVRLSKKAEKSLGRLPRPVLQTLTALMRQMEKSGPVRGDWANYGKLGFKRHHCHIKKGKPTYVAVWEELESGIQIVEVTYAGTHEKAPY
ncbi:MAG: cytotoxic translational repressor of toxin-antitoxin stability system [Deltaproteobacteria bacterium]|jgi:mRNA-degrading endonuclease RelE of RelBE toxin-antitoxin system|nr:cytotoxic translational repressor of toxin-antitoxin stability system [Deltaproteobacteria bacterium]